MATVKTTQKEMFNAIIKALKGENAGFTMDELIEFAEGRIAVLDKKSASRKTKVNEADEILKTEAFDTLAAMSEPSTVTALMNVNSYLGQESNQKISAILRKLVAEGKVERFKDKKTTLFSAVVEE